MGLLRSAAPTSQMGSAQPASSKSRIKYDRVISLTGVFSHVETGIGREV
jgi:hypothetical protein